MRYFYDPRLVKEDGLYSIDIYRRRWGKTSRLTGAEGEDPVRLLGGVRKFVELLNTSSRIDRLRTERLVKKFQKSGNS